MHALLVCPDAALAARLEVTMGRLGYSTATEADPGLAHDAALARPPRLVLIDWDALGADALDLTEPLRSAPGRPTIVAVTRRAVERSVELLASRLPFINPEDDEGLLELRLSMIVAFTPRREEEDLRFLAEASAVLSSTLDFEATLHNIARLALVHLADFCVIDVCDETGMLKRADAVHRDPSLQPVMAVVHRQRPSERAGIYEVMRTGRAIVYNDAPAERFVEWAANAEHLEALHKLRPTSGMVIPMVAHGNVEGVITLGSSKAGGAYDEQDLALANELAARAGLAIANARLHRELTLSETKLRALAEAAFEGIVVQENGRILLANHRAAEMFGYSVSEVIGTELLQYVAPESREVVRAVVAAGKTQAYEAQCLRKDGTTFPAEVQGREAVFQGRHVRMAAIRDVGEQRALQARLMLSDRLSAMGTLAAGVAHEINNPLSFVSLSIDYAQSRLGPHEGEVMRALSDAAAGAERVRRIVRDLRTLSRVEEDRRVPVDVRRVLEASLGIAGNELRHKARVVTHLENVPAVAASEWRLGQLFLNLLVNAGQAIAEGAPEKNEVRVSTSAREQRVVIEIADTGAGIPEAIRARIFDPFFTTKPAGVGTGLGLSICQNIVTELGGRIEVESEPGKGTTFRVTLPMAQGSVVEVVPQPAQGAQKRARVLVVDDEPLLRHSIVRLLAPAHDAKAVASGEEALQLVRSGEPFDVLLCDVMMPGMSGPDLHRQLQHEKPDLASHTIFLTGGVFSGPAAEFLDTVKNPRLEKPFEPKALLAAIASFA